MRTQLTVPDGRPYQVPHPNPDVDESRPLRQPITTIYRPPIDHGCTYIDGFQFGNSRHLHQSANPQRQDSDRPLWHLITWTLPRRALAGSQPNFRDAGDQVFFKVKSISDNRHYVESGTKCRSPIIRIKYLKIWLPAIDRNILFHHLSYLHCCGNRFCESDKGMSFRWHCNISTWLLLILLNHIFTETGGSPFLYCLHRIFIDIGRTRWNSALALSPPGHL